MVNFSHWFVLQCAIYLPMWAPHIIRLAIPCLTLHNALPCAINLPMIASPITCSTKYKELVIVLLHFTRICNLLANVSLSPICGHCLQSQMKKGCGDERELFHARFPTFCRAFQNTFYPVLAHFSTLSMAWFLPLRGGWGGVRWHPPHIAEPPPVLGYAMHLHCASQKLTSPKWSANEWALSGNSFWEIWRQSGQFCVFKPTQAMHGVWCIWNDRWWPPSLDGGGSKRIWRRVMFKSTL